MFRFIFNRLIHALFVLLMISIAVFIISHLSGDPVYLMVPPEAKIEDIEILRFLELGWSVQMVELSGESIAVDTFEDLELVRGVMAAP